jgi:membrane fusion protein, heavy metal efflux system
MYKSIFLITISVLLFGCKSSKESEIKNATTSLKENQISLTDAQAKNAKIETLSLSSTNMTSSLRVYGHSFFPPENMVTITSSYGGIIKSIRVIQGQFVTKGQTIATLEDPRFIDFQQDYLLTKSKLKLAQLDYDRQRDLNQAKANSDKVYQIAENEFRTNQILFKSLSEKLKLLGINPQNLSENNLTRSVTISSPATGFISNVFANAGKYISPSESIAEIINQSNPFLKLKIYEKDLLRVHIGMRLKAYSNSDTSIKYTCEIKSINPNVSEDGSTDVVCSFINLNKKMYQNMNLIAELALSQGQANSLPEDAIVDFEGKSYVFILLEKNKFQITEIMKGNSENGQTEILNPAEIQSKKIVSKGSYTLLMAMKNKEEE